MPDERISNAIQVCNSAMMAVGVIDGVLQIEGMSDAEKLRAIAQTIEMHKNEQRRVYGNQAQVQDSGKG